MFLKLLTVFSILVCGQCAWKYSNQQTTRVQLPLDGYKHVADAILYDRVNSVRGLDRVYLPEKHSFIPSGLANFSKFEKVDSDRTLKFDAYIYAFELLLPGEQLFMRKRKEVLIKARAFLYGQEECNRLKSLIASACKIKEMIISQDEKDFIQISYKLGFVQKALFGEVDDRGNLTYEEEHAHFYKIFKTSYRTLKEQEEIRLSYYEKISKYCEQIREFLGTCAIDTIDFRYKSKTESFSKLPKTESFSKLPKTESFSKLPKTESSSEMSSLEVDVLYTSLVAMEHKQISQRW